MLKIHITEEEIILKLFLIKLWWRKFLWLWIIYTFFNLPNIIDVNPKSALLKANDQQIDIKLDKLDYNGKNHCSKGIKCRFVATKEFSNKFVIMEGKFVEKILCNSPNVTIPEEFNLKVSINGRED